MALANYSDLLTALSNWSKRTDLTSVYPDFVSLAEARMSKDLRIRSQVSTATLTCVAGTQTVALPSDFLEAENLTITSTTPQGSLSVVTPEYMDRKYPAGYSTAQPAVYCTIGSNFLLGPTPDAAYTISLVYYTKVPSLQTNSTNWLMTNHPAIYLAACMAELSAYTFDDERISAWNERYQAEITAIRKADDDALRSGSAMRVRTV